MISHNKIYIVLYELSHISSIISLYGNFISPEGAKWILEALKGNHSITTLE